MPAEGEKIYVNHASLFEEGSRQIVKYGTRNIAVFCYKKKFYAIDNACYHHGGPLLQGDIEELGRHVCVVCPWHRYLISLETGEGLYMSLEIGNNNQKPNQSLKSKGLKQRVHKVIVENDEVFVQVDLGGPVLESDTYAAMEIANQEEAMSFPISNGITSQGLHSGIGIGQKHLGLAGANKIRPSPLSRSPNATYYPNFHIQCHSVLSVCHNVKEFFFRLTEGKCEPLPEQGQHAELVLPICDANGLPMIRKWTICDLARNQSLFSLIIKAKGTNSGSDWMHKHALQKTFEVRRVAGTFTLTHHMPQIRAYNGQVLFLTAGIGITSAYANISTYLGDSFFLSSPDHLHIVHLHVDRCSNSMAKANQFIYWHQKFNPIAAEAASFVKNKSYCLSVFLTQPEEDPNEKLLLGKNPILWGKVQVSHGRRLNKEDLHRFGIQAFQMNSFIAFICGPDEFVTNCHDALRSLGVDEKDIILGNNLS